MYLLRCTPSTATVTCADPDDIETKIYTSYFKTSYSVWSVDPSTTTSILYPKHSKTSGMIHQALVRLRSFRWNSMAMEFNSDEGWITKSNKVQNITTYERSQIEFIDSGYESVIFFFNLKMSGNMASYSRQYQRRFKVFLLRSVVLWV